MSSVQTRIFVTHGLAYLPQVDNIIMLNNGEVVESGTYSQLLRESREFSQLIRQHKLNEAGTNDEANDKGMFHPGLSGLGRRK